MGAGRDRSRIDRDLFLLVVTPLGWGHTRSSPLPYPSMQKSASRRLYGALRRLDIHPKGQANDQATDG
jgi:hypothetical protein